MLSCTRLIKYLVSSESVETTADVDYTHFHRKNIFPRLNVFHSLTLHLQVKILMQNVCTALTVSKTYMIVMFGTNMVLTLMSIL